MNCTAGWPVQGRTTGYWFLVTAAHCGYDGQYWWNGDFSQGIGYATGEKPYEDDAWGTYECRGDMFLADQIYGEPGCRGGDSGGPVFSLNSDYSRVVAEGIISGCGDLNGSSLVAFQDYATIRQIEDVLIY